MEAVKAALLLTVLIGFLYASVGFATVVFPAYTTRLPEFEATYHRWGRKVAVLLVVVFVAALAAGLAIPGFTDCVFAKCWE